MDVMPRVGKVSCCAVRPAADDGPGGHALGYGRPVVDTRPSLLRLHSGSGGAEALAASSAHSQTRHGDARGGRRATDRQRTVLLIVALPR